MSNVIFSTSIGQTIKDELAKSSFNKLAVIVDNNTSLHCLPLIEINNATIIEISSGEKNKNLESCSKIWNELTSHGFDRNGLVINLGGGVIGDMGGFCASTFKRGIKFINIPTTLLSQVDASVGGKLGIDFNGYKNHIGLFNDPISVLIDPIFLKTLPDRELKSGFAEVIKHHLINDKEGWNTLKNTPFSNIDWFKTIQHSVAIKNKIVSEDPLESGLRKILNFGHTVGHAIESYFLNTNEPLLHGEAIAHGMICESYISFSNGNIEKLKFDEINNYLTSQFEIRKIKKSDYETIWELMQQDKKNSDSNVLTVLLQDIGDAVYDCQISKEETFNALHSLT